MNTYSISIHWDESEEEFIATSKEFPYLSGIADTKEEALDILDDCIQGGLEMLAEDKDIPPQPYCMPEYSGNIRLRLPKSLHKLLAEMSEFEGVSLNQFMVTLLAMNASRTEIHHHNLHLHINNEIDTSENVRSIDVGSPVSLPTMQMPALSDRLQVAQA